MDVAEEAALRGWTEALRRAAVASLHLTMFVPLLVCDGLYFPFVTGKAYVFRTLVTVGLICWVLVAVKAPQFRPRRSPVLVAGVLFAAMVLLADLVGPDPYLALAGGLERMDGFVSLMYFGAFLVSCGSLLKTRTQWFGLLRTSVEASSVIALLALLQQWGLLEKGFSAGRIDGTLGNPSFLAGYLVVHIFLAIFLLVEERPHGGTRWLYRASVVIYGSVLMLNGTRSAAAAVLAGGGVGVLVMMVGAQRRLRAMGVVAVALAVCLAVAVLALRLPGIGSIKVVQRLRSISVEDTTIRSRLLLWRMAVNGIAERPLLGWGQEGFSVVADQRYDPRLWFHREPFFDRPHNVMLQRGIEAGIPGLLAYLAVFAAAGLVVKDGELGRAGKAALGGFLAAYLGHVLFVFEDIASSITVAATLALLHWIGSAATPPPKYRLSRISSTLTVCGALLGSAALYHWSVVRPLLAERQLCHAVSLQATDPERSLSCFAAALKRTTMVTPTACERLVEAAGDAQKAPSVLRGLRDRLAAVARQEMGRYLAAHPLDARRRLLFGSFLNQLGDAEEAHKVLDDARALAPNRQDILFEVAAAAINRHAYERALTATHDAFELDPSYPKARDLYAIAAAYAGKRQLAFSLLSPQGGLMTLPNEHLVAALAACGDFSGVVKTVRRLKCQLGGEQRTSLLTTAIAEVERAARDSQRLQHRARRAVVMLRLEGAAPCGQTRGGAAAAFPG